MYSGELEMETIWCRSRVFTSVSGFQLKDRGLTGPLSRKKKKTRPFRTGLNPKLQTANARRGAAIKVSNYVQAIKKIKFL